MREQFIMNILGTIQEQLPIIILTILSGCVGYYIVRWFIKPNPKKEDEVKT